MPATLPQLLRSDYLHAPPPLDSPLTIPTARYSPACNRLGPQHATALAQPALASSRSQHSCRDACNVQRRYSDVSCGICPRLGASDAAPSSPIQLPARTTAPRLAPPKPHHPLQPRAKPPQPATRNIISAFAGGSQASARSAAAPDARRVPLRSSDVSCAISARLGASDAAPAPPISLPACTAAPRLAPRKPHRPLQPRAQLPQPATRNSISAQPAVRKYPLTAAAADPATYQGGTATSAAPSLRDSVQATLPHHLRCN
jgi:hypothetical protein